MMMDPGFGFSSFENTFAIVLVIVVIGFIVVIGSFIVMAVRARPNGTGTISLPG